MFFKNTNHESNIKILNQGNTSQIVITSWALSFQTSNMNCMIGGSFLKDACGAWGVRETAVIGKNYIYITIIYFIRTIYFIKTEYNFEVFDFV